MVENDIEMLLVNLTSGDPAVVLTPASVPVIIFESDCKSQTNYYIDNILNCSSCTSRLSICLECRTDASCDINEMFLPPLSSTNGIPQSHEGVVHLTSSPKRWTLFKCFP